MEDLRERKNIELQKSKRRKYYFFSFLKKYKYRIILTIIILLILIFPVKSGYLIGKFITDFLGTLINNINL